MRSLLLRLTFAAAILVMASQPAAAALFELITATDPVAEFTMGSGVITSLDSGGGGTEATVLPGSSLGSGNTMHLELQLDGTGEQSFTFGTGFEGTWPLSSPELIILDGVGTPLLTADLTTITVTGQSLVPGTAGSVSTSVTLGVLDLVQTHLVLTGGTEAANFGGIGALGQMSVLINSPSVDWDFGSVFDEDFTAQMNVQLQFFVAPEPGTGLLVGLSLLGLALRERRRLRKP